MELLINICEIRYMKQNYIDIFSSVAMHYVLQYFLQNGLNVCCK